MYIDAHVHCRDGTQSYKETISHALEVAEKVGVDAIFDMPNTNPPITTRGLVEERLEIANKCNSPVFYGLYFGITPYYNQIAEAVEIHRELFPRVVGLKLFAGKSVGDLAVRKEGEQRQVYEALSNCGYKGVLAVHCEKEFFLKPTQFYPGVPETHSFARPSIAELESIKDQVKFSREADFKGTLQIAHISTPESVKYVDSVRKDGDLKISCGATPHHLFLNYNEWCANEDGLLFKVNPPLRSRQEQEGLLKCLKDGKIDWIETDHAPHTKEEKIKFPYMSGIPGLNKWGQVLTKLRTKSFSYQQIENLVFNNVYRTFQIPEGIITRTENLRDVNLNEYEYRYNLLK